MIEYHYVNEFYIPSFREALDQVAKERIYINMTKAFPLDEVRNFQLNLKQKNLPCYYAVFDNKVVGWCDITHSQNSMLKHRGWLGMGIVKKFRGQGIGTQLMRISLDHAKRIGLEKVELCVFTENIPAIQLYKKMGFREIGITHSFRKLDGRYWDVLNMEKFL